MNAHLANHICRYQTNYTSRCQPFVRHLLNISFILLANVSTIHSYLSFGVHACTRLEYSVGPVLFVLYKLSYNYVICDCLLLIQNNLTDVSHSAAIASFTTYNI